MQREGQLCVSEEWGIDASWKVVSSRQMVEVHFRGAEGHQVHSAQIKNNSKVKGSAFCSVWTEAV